MRTGRWTASAHCPPARTSSSSTGSRRKVCASTATRTCRWRPRIAAKAVPQADSQTTCANVWFGAQEDGGHMSEPRHDQQPGRALAGRGGVGCPASWFGRDRTALVSAGRIVGSRRGRRAGWPKRTPTPSRSSPSRGARPQTRSAVGCLGRRVRRCRRCLPTATASSDARRHQGVVFGRGHLHTCLGDGTGRQRTSRSVRRRPR